MFALLIIAITLFTQPDQVHLTLENPSKEALHLRIENFNIITIAPDSESNLSMVSGERIYGRKLLKNDEWKEFEMLTVDHSHHGKVINAYKVFKKKSKD